MSEGQGRNTPRQGDRSATTSRLTPSDPGHIGLPRARRNYVIPILLALAVFVVIIAIRMMWA